ncbi:MAG: glycosyltransferase family 39 protein, partial [Anaerolineae bacterium]
MTDPAGSRPRRLSSARWALILILIPYLVVGVIYSLATPVLEASDEFKHYPYVQYVQTQHDLPVLDPETCLETPSQCPWLQDGGQPPTYYILLAAATSWIDTSDLTDLRRVNWHAFIGNPGQVCNKNLVIHRPERERFPWRGSVLAVHVGRFITVVIGAGSVVLTNLTVRELFPERLALVLGATALTAFNPMFIFVNASVNNDAMTTFVGCLNLLLFVRMVRDGRRERLPLWRYGLVGLVVGLFLLTKLSALTALMLLPVLLAWISYRRRSHRPLVIGLPVVLGVAVLMSGWWFLRNWRLYGDLTGLNAFIAIQGRRGGFPSMRDWIEEFVTFRWTYWGLFGAVNVMAPRWVYRLFDVLSLAGLLGFVVSIVRETRQSLFANRQSPIAHSPISLFVHSLIRNSLWWIPALWGGILFVSVLRWTRIFYSFQGRFLFPNVAGISALLMLGLHQWVPSGYRLAFSLGVAVILLVIAAILPFSSIIPAYQQPEPLALSDVPKSARVEPVDVGGVARIVGWEFEEQTVRLNEPVATADAAIDLVVYWQAATRDGGDYVSFARLLGRGHELAGEINRRPACGMVPTDLWEPGQVWRDPYRIPVAEGARRPSRLRVEAGLYDPREGETLGVVRVGESKLASSELSLEAEHPLVVGLTDGIALRGYDVVPTGARAGETITVTLYWEARQAPATDYQVFIHLLGDRAEPVAQGDAPPLTGDYPTSMWGSGENIVDPHRIRLPVDLAPG